MDPAALTTFVIIALFVWGGLALIVLTALRRESGKVRPASESPPRER